MDERSGGGTSAPNPSFIAKLKGCSGCQQRKEAVSNMLTSGNFWIGVAVGVGGVYAYHKFVKKA
jgi:hypothetical protein